MITIGGGEGGSPTTVVTTEEVTKVITLGNNNGNQETGNAAPDAAATDVAGTDNAGSDDDESDDESDDAGTGGDANNNNAAGGSPAAGNAGANKGENGGGADTPESTLTILFTVTLDESQPTGGADSGTGLGNGGATTTSVPVLPSTPGQGGYGKNDTSHAQGLNSTKPTTSLDGGNGNSTSNSTLASRNVLGSRNLLPNDYKFDRKRTSLIYAPASTH